MKRVDLILYNRGQFWYQLDRLRGADGGGDVCPGRSGKFSRKMDGGRKGVSRMRFRVVMVCLLMLTVLGSGWIPVQAGKPAASSKPAREETIAGTVLKTDQGLVIEADDGDYLVKGSKVQELTKMVGKLIEVTGVITETPKGEVIEVKSFEEIQE